MLAIFGVEYFELGCDLGDMIRWDWLEREAMLLETKFLLAMVLALMVEQVEELMSRASASMIRSGPYIEHDDSKNQLAQFFHQFSFNHQNGEVQFHETCTDEGFVHSQYRVNYICSYGSLILLLHLLEGEAEVAFDLQGDQLHGRRELWLTQLTLRKDPTLVHVIDIWALGKKAFDIATASGMSLRSVLESRTVTKSWFDGQNHVGVLEHQLDIKPQNVLDMQRAYALSRILWGDFVTSLPGLAQCISDCCSVNFLKFSKHLGQDLCGNDGHTILTKRPLHPALIIYKAAHARFLFDLQDALAKELDCLDALAKEIGDETWRGKVVTM